MPAEEKSLVEAIRQSSIWIKKCSQTADQSDIKASDRNRVAAALFHLVMEHHGSILHLAKLKHYGSAFALIRPQLEAYIRGVWFHHCAAQKEITHFLADNEPPKIKELITRIETLPFFEEGSLSQLKDKVWKVLCDFTHGGYVQVSWRLSGNEIVSDFGDEQVIILIGLADALTLKTVVALSMLAENETMAQKVMTSHKEIFGGKA